MAFDFEPEVELPDDPYNAAIIFFAVAAYPERGAGQLGAPGEQFATSLLNYMRWQARHHMGLAQFRKEMGNHKFSPPQWAEFRGRMNRGLKRLRRRAACYSLHGTRMFNGFFALAAICSEAEAQGRIEDVYDMAPTGNFGVAKPGIWARAIRSARGTVSHDVDRWARRFGLNVTGKSSDDKQKAKDLIRRAVKQSLPVLHFAHAIEEACNEVGPTIGGWGQRDPVLALLMNADKWIDKAVVTAERWRLTSGHPMNPDVTPDGLVRLTRKNLVVNAPSSDKPRCAILSIERE